MNSADDYTPPSSAEIASKQNSPEALRLLLAQRKMHSKAKFWSTIRTVGVAAIAIIAPILAILKPEYAVVAAAVAGAWVFLGRTFLANLQLSKTHKAAAIQEDFDVLVFGMPGLAPKSPRASLEDIEVLVGPAEAINKQVVQQKLENWYPVDPATSGLDAVAIAQRANASYSSRLLNLNRRMWMTCVVVWVIASVSVGMAFSWTLETFILGLFLPILPALLDVFEQWRLTTAASRERSELALSIEEKLAGVEEHHVQPQDLLIWQERMYSLRISTPQTANFLYKITRESNERAMKGAADHLANNSNSADGGRS
ncbi:S-4TM family putative pore-forming effector [Glutamicibacter sp. MNS18]|uniref:S-4TM family putative pore-forming effector n=1 Tax=Glutamicibacter sp. MNS18 TaxID=2989817 RepID=UPI002236BD06|nr:S-4TM family putative pore-forming effector [Glutamicibacter sp. MNS18]MCW4467264.1 S-4TM family putative pore-forming effector [Glutamicibacter sp. MNS18]